MTTLNDFYAEMGQADYVQEGDTFGGSACGLYTFGLVTVFTVETDKYVSVKVVSAFRVSNFCLSVQYGDYTPVLAVIDAMQLHTF